MAKSEKEIAIESFYKEAHCAKKATLTIGTSEVAEINSRVKLLGFVRIEPVDGRDNYYVGIFHDK